jgi:hypothetical protein
MRVVMWSLCLRATPWTPRSTSIWSGYGVSFLKRSYDTLCLSPLAALHRLRSRVPRCLQGVRHYYSALVDRGSRGGIPTAMMRISPMLRARERERERWGGRERELPLSSRRKLHTRPARVAKISTGSTVLNSKEHNIRQKTWSSLRLTRLTTNHPQRSPFQDSIVSRTRDPRRTDTDADKQTQTHSNRHRHTVCTHSLKTR